MRRQELDLIQIMAAVSDAAVVYEKRWIMGVLKTADPDLYGRLIKQQELYHAMLVTGSDREVRMHAGAMIRGWKAAVARMEELGIEENAYVLGYHKPTDSWVAVARQKPAAGKIMQIDGKTVTFVTPDEVATMVVNLGMVRQVKETWPGAEIVDIRAAMKE